VDSQHDLTNEIGFALLDQSNPRHEIVGTAEMLCGALFLRFKKHDRMVYLEMTEGNLAVEVYDTAEDNEQMLGSLVVSLPVKAEV